MSSIRIEPIPPGSPDGGEVDGAHRAVAYMDTPDGGLTPTCEFGACGYDVGVLAGSQDNLLTLEYRRDFTPAGVTGRWQARLFGDTGRAKVYKKSFERGIDSGRLSSAGLGLNWSGPHEWNASASLAKPIGNVPDILPNANSEVRLDEGFRLSV